MLGQSSPNAATPPEVEDIGVPLYARLRSTGGARPYVGWTPGALSKNAHCIAMNTASQ